MNKSFDNIIKQTDIKIRKKWDIHPATKVLKSKKAITRTKLKEQLKKELNSYDEDNS